MTQRGPIVDIIGAAAVSVLAIVLLNSGVVRAALAVEPTFRVLTIAAAAAGAAAALLAAVISRITGDPRPSWIAAALVLYCLIVLPWSTVVASQLDVTHRAARLVAYLGALIVLLCAIRPPRMLRAWGGWMLLVATGLLAIVVLELPESGATRWFADGPDAHRGRARRLDGRGRRVRRRRLAPSQPPTICGWASAWSSSRSASSTGWRRADDAVHDLAFAALRLVGLLIVLVALAQLTQLALRSVESAQWRQQEELSAAALHMGRAQETAAERDHELRNGLAGLAGITHLLSDDTARRTTSGSSTPCSPSWAACTRSSTAGCWRRRPTPTTPSSP